MIFIWSHDQRRRRVADEVDLEIAVSQRNEWLIAEAKRSFSVLLDSIETKLKHPRNSMIRIARTS